MKAIILAAGRGKRLAPLTDHIPKCMVRYQGIPLIDYITQALAFEGINDLVIVSGYKDKVLRNHLANDAVRYYHNSKYQNTNMVYSLFCAENELNDDIIISYSDIIYSSSTLKMLIADPSPFAVVVDKDWEKLWRIRMEDPLCDAETMKLNDNNFIIELGKKPNSLSQIQGQYIGLLKIKKQAWVEIIKFYHSLNVDNLYDGQRFENMYMTTFIQLIIEKLMPVKAVLVKNNWLEIDSISDIKAYQLHNINIK